MNTNIKQASMILGKVVRKIGESALHAAVFAYVSGKVSEMMDKAKGDDKEKVRVEETPKTETTNS